ncbi:MAG: tRNA (N(6)-L-threonylcarbamoyladenosine(37)-C(2))-methylthiotransferase MtaB [Eubacteriales bacterium]|nr:tRNA (N(6)-L-threonylcarbamoyladenosine(37)-C(2))-methylthiotransferase MtaB [Eubacteriales bacterium]
MKSVAFHNLGCKVNSYETDVMQQKLLESGFCVVPFDKKADVYVINTCTVTNIADRKSRQMLHRAKKLNPEALVVAVGCYVETDPEKVALDPAIDLAIGNNKKGEIAELILTWMEQREERAGKEAGEQAHRTGDSQAGDGKADASAAMDKTMCGATMEDLTHAPAYEEMRLTSPGHTRAYIKIQDGCNQFCSYCIIPYARGRIRSRKREDILEEVRRLAEVGVREIVLTGIHISSFGLERGGPELAQLLEELQEIRGIGRIRLGSLEPRIVTEEFAARIAALSKVCPHFHLSLQSGCDETLCRMNRRYTTREYAQSVERLRRYFRNPAICTDIIVGFPQETEEEFAETMAFVEEIRFYEIHVFKYSVRRGTAAARMAGQIPEAVKAQRSDRLLAVTARQAAEYRAQFVGKREELLLEEEIEINGTRYLTGHTTRYVQGVIGLGSGPDGQPAAQADRHGAAGAADAAQNQADAAQVAGTAAAEPSCPGQLVQGVFGAPVEGTEYLRFEEEAGDCNMSV